MINNENIAGLFFILCAFIIIMGMIISTHESNLNKIKLEVKAIESGYIQCIEERTILWKKECK